MGFGQTSTGLAASIKRLVSGREHITVATRAAIDVSRRLAYLSPLLLLLLVIAVVLLSKIDEVSGRIVVLDET